MSFFSKLFGTKPKQPSRPAFGLVVPTPQRPTEAELLPGVLSVRAHAHSMPKTDGRFVTLMSRGLISAGQREILFTLKTDEGDALAAQLEDLSLFLAQVHQWASAGKIVHSFGFTQFGPRGLLGQRHNGIIYLDAEPIPGIELPERALAAVVLNPSEIALVTGGLPFRVLNRRGEDARFFPSPLWTDLHAAPPMEGDDHSVLTKVACGNCPGISVLAEASRVRMTIDADGRAGLRRALGQIDQTRPIAFVTEPAASANARFVWRPGQRQPAAITPPGSDGSRITGVFLLVSGGVERDEIRLLEDGHALMLTARSLDAFWNAMKREQPFSLLAADDMSFELEWALIN